MASFNKVILVGNLTRSPELRSIPSGTSVTDIGLAVNSRRKSLSGESIDETLFVDITLWGREAEVVCQYATKGSPLLVEGRLKQESWESEGQKRTKMKVIGERVQMLSSRSGGGGGSDEEGGGYAPRQNTRPAGNSGRSTSSAQQHDYYDTQDGGDDVPF